MKQQLEHIPRVDKAPWVTRFGRVDHSWDIHDDEDEEDGGGTGLPGRALVHGALRIFADCWGSYDAETAARIFNLPTDLIGAWAPEPPFEQDPEYVAIGELVTCLQVLAGCRTRWGALSVADAAALLNQHPTRIIEAVGQHPWMYIIGDRDDFAKLWIEHDGE